MGRMIVPAGSGAVFVVGVTGHIDLRAEDEEGIRREVREFLLGLKAGREKQGAGGRLMWCPDP